MPGGVSGVRGVKPNGGKIPMNEYFLRILNRRRQREILEEVSRNRLSRDQGKTDRPAPLTARIWFHPRPGVPERLWGGTVCPWFAASAHGDSPAPRRRMR